MKKLLALLLLACMALSLTPAMAEGQVLKYGTEAEPAGLDPHTISHVASLRIMNQMYNQLVDLDDSLNVIPELALSWEMPDDKTYVFKLRDDVKFHNGRAMTAADVVYSFERILDPNLGALGNSANFYAMIEKVEALDDATVQFVLKDINAPFLANLANSYASIVCKEVVESAGDLLRADGGTGPFLLDEWTPDNRVVVKKFADYYEAGLPVMDAIEYYVMADSAARLAALRTGNVHLIYAEAADLPKVKDDANIQVLSYQSASYSCLCLNMNKEEFKDIRVRQAISLAVDRAEIIDMAYDGAAEVSGFATPSMGHWAVDVKDHPLYQQDVERAKSLMAEAGYPDGFECVITVGLLDTIRDIGTVLEQQLAAIGIKVTIENLENAQYIEKWSAHNFDMMVCENGSGSDPSRAVAFFFGTGAAANIAEYSNARVDELCALAAGTSDTAAREGYYHEAIGIILEECPNIVFASPMKYFFALNTLKGYQPTAMSINELKGAYIE